MKTPRILFAGVGTLPRAADIFKAYFASKSVPIEIHVRADLDKKSLADVAWEWDADFVRCDLDLGSDWLAGLPVHPLSVSRYQAADAFVRKGKKWDPELLIEPAFRENIVKRGNHLDLRASAYVVGEGLCARIIAGVVLGLGYRKVWLVGPDDHDLEIHRKVLERMFVGTALEVVSEEALTLQTTAASLLVNTLNLDGRAELAADLAYFNFMIPGGLVVDLNGSRDERPVLVEAERAGLRIIPPSEIAASREWKLAVLCGLGAHGSEREFHEFWDQQAST